MDLFIGEPAAEFGSMVEETPEGLHYNWEKADRLVKVLEMCIRDRDATYGPACL